MSPSFSSTCSPVGQQQHQQHTYHHRLRRCPHRRPTKDRRNDCSTSSSYVYSNYIDGYHDVEDHHDVRKEEGFQSTDVKCVDGEKELNVEQKVSDNVHNLNGKIIIHDCRCHGDINDGEEVGISQLSMSSTTDKNYSTNRNMSNRNHQWLKTKPKRRRTMKKPHLEQLTVSSFFLPPSSQREHQKH